MAPVPAHAEHTELLRRLDQTPDGTDGYKFKIGKTVHFLPTRNLYVVIAVLPERDGEREYCINNETEPYQRLAKESEMSLSLSPLVGRSHRRQDLDQQQADMKDAGNEGLPTL